MVREIVREFREEVVKTFLATLILVELKKKAMGGYDVIRFIHRKFHILLSSGTVYATIYSLERKGLIKGMFTGRKRSYTLTKEGEKRIEAILGVFGEVQSFMTNFLK